jgi:hypothetical protein
MFYLLSFIQYVSYENTPLLQIVNQKLTSRDFCGKLKKK